MVFTKVWSLKGVLGRDQKMPSWQSSQPKSPVDSA